MSAQWLLLSYIAAGLIAMFLLVRFHPAHWYTHALAVLAGVLVGLVPPGSWTGNMFYLATGVACVWLVVWGVGGLLLLAGLRLRHASLIMRY